MTSWDRILIALVIAVSIVGTLLVQVLSADTEQSYIAIEVDGEVQRTINMQQNKRGRTYDFMFGDSIGYVEVKNGAVRMLEMDRKICPREICSKTGWISEDYQSIVCLPNRISVRFVNKDNDGIDVLSY